MLTDEFINVYSKNNVFTYGMFKLFFNEILKKVYKLKKDSIFLTSDTMNEIDELLNEAIKFKELYFYCDCNKRNYFEKLKITVHIFLLKLEVNSLE